LKIIIAIVIFSAIILFHELGHFLFAKLNKIVVTEFSLGMGPRLYSFEKGDTRYSLKLLPIGGSCAMLGEDTDIENEPGTFNSASVWERSAAVQLIQKKLLLLSEKADKSKGSHDGDCNHHKTGELE